MLNKNFTVNVNVNVNFCMEHLLYILHIYVHIFTIVNDIAYSESLQFVSFCLLVYSGDTARGGME